MKLTTTHIEAIREFISNNKNKDDRLTLSELQDYLKKLTMLTFEVRFVNTTDKYISIFGNGIYIELYKFDIESNPKGFTWITTFSTWENGENVELDITRILKCVPILQILNASKSNIQQEVIKVLPACEKFVENKELLDDANWCFRRAEQFYDLFKENKEVDTDECLKFLYKQKMENWDDRINKNYDGKISTINTYKRVFERVESVYKKIKNEK